MWMPARLTVPPGRTTCNATGTSSPAGSEDDGPVARAGRQLGGVTDPRRSHLARELAVPVHRGSTPPSRNPSDATPGSPGAPDAPNPINATRSPGCTSARRSARYPITPAQSSGAASRSSSASGNRTANGSGTVSASGVPAVDGPPGEVGVLAQVLFAAHAELAVAVGVVQPRHADRDHRAAGTRNRRPAHRSCPPPGAPVSAEGAEARDRLRRRADRSGNNRTRWTRTRTSPGPGSGSGRARRGGAVRNRSAPGRAVRRHAPVQRTPLAVLESPARARGSADGRTAHGHRHVSLHRPRGLDRASGRSIPRR